MLFTHRLGGGTGSTTGSGCGSSFASAAFRLRIRRLSGYRSAAIRLAQEASTARPRDK